MIWLEIKEIFLVLNLLKEINNYNNYMKELSYQTQI